MADILPRPEWMHEHQTCYVIGALRGTADAPRDFYLTVAARWTTAGAWNPSAQYVRDWPDASIAFYRMPEHALAALHHAPSWPNDGGAAPIVRWYPCYGPEHVHMDESPMA